MQIGQVIRKYRKRKNITQEEMAVLLGVTAPAVNKWENGVSFPDIMLLAPIARLLGITPDTLLSFQEELTEKEINDMVCEADLKIREASYEEAFQWAKEKLEQYPNCEELALQFAQIFDGWRLIKQTDDKEAYDRFISRWYVRALESDREHIRSTAADALFEFYYRKEQYEKAEEYLAYLPEQNPERKRKQASVYSATNRKDEAYKAYEELLFSQYQMSSEALHSLYMLAMQDRNMEKAHMLVEKQTELARLFEMGAYHEASAGLEIAAVEKDGEAVTETMERMLSSIDHINAFTESSLYEHLTFREPREEFFAEVKRNLLKCFCDEESFGFLKNNAGWEKIRGIADEREL